MVMINASRVNDRIAQMGYSKQGIANRLEISVGSLSNKLNGKTEFTLSEARKLAFLLGISRKDIIEFFYANEVGKMPTLEE